jgi:hypothetical protein
VSDLSNREALSPASRGEFDSGAEGYHFTRKGAKGFGFLPGNLS